MTQKRTSSFISRIAAISLFLALPATHLAAQNRPGKAQNRPGKVQGKTKAQTAVAEKDTIPFFRGVAVSADLIGIAETTLGDYGQYEAALRINLRDKYFPVIEVGYGKADADDPLEACNLCASFVISPSYYYQISKFPFSIKSSIKAGLKTLTIPSLFQLVAEQ